MYTQGIHNNVYPGYIRYNSVIDKHTMYTQGHHNNVYPGYIRYTSDLDKHQQCIPRVIITMCIQGT